MKQKFIDKFLDTDRFEYDIYFTEDKGHATRLCEQALMKNYDIIAAVGGDGTLNEVGRVLIGTDIQLAIIPAGSGNGFARHIGVPLTLKGALKVINNGKVRKIDTATIETVEGADSQKKEVFLSTAGVGFDAEMAYEFTKIEKRGFWPYIWAVARNFFTYKLKEYEIRVGNQLIKTRAFVVAFANSSQYGNNATISPTASLEDGFIDVCIFKGFSWLKLPELVFRFFNKTLDKSGYLDVIKTKQVIIKRNSNLVHIDGDSVVLDEELEIKIKPLSLNMLVRNEEI